MTIDKKNFYISRKIDKDGMNERHQLLKDHGNDIKCITNGSYPVSDIKNNIENYIGTVKIPIGIAGPLLIDGDYAKGKFLIPLATTEGTLVASINRGLTIIQESGGVKTKVWGHAIQRTPCLRFSSIAAAERFTIWARKNFKNFQKWANSTTKYGKLVNMEIFNYSRSLNLRFSMDPDNAAGQNMVSKAIFFVRTQILKNYPYSDEIVSFIMTANHDSDKKASAMSNLLTRGKRVTAEVDISRDILEKHLRITPEIMIDAFHDGYVASQFTGAPMTCHAANPIAAMFLACGQDIACIAESHVAMDDVRISKKGVLFSIIIPSLICGTVGGGTGLPTQNACLKMIDCVGENSSLKLAEIIAATTLAADISLAGAIFSIEWTKAHENMGRNRPNE